MKRLDLLSLYAIFMILTGLDAGLTTYLLLFGDYELNPILNWLLEITHTTLILWLCKFIMLLIVALAIRLTSGTKHETRMWRVMIGANAIMIPVVFWGSYLAIRI